MSKVIFFHNHEGKEMICVEFMDSDELIVHLFKCQPKVASTPNFEGLFLFYFLLFCLVLGAGWVQPISVKQSSSCLFDSR